MRKALVILNYRGGSNLFNFLNGSPSISSIQTGKEHFNPNIPSEDRKVSLSGCSSEAYWMATVPSKTCVSDHIYSFSAEQMISTSEPVELLSWRGNVGDWWGEVSSHEDVPGPYDVETFYRFGPDELRSLGEEWSFVYLIRDGRNQIESIRNIRGGYEARKVAENADDYFRVLCKGFRNRARLAVDCSRSIPDFHLFRFEDLIADPISVMTQIYNVLGVELDVDQAVRALKFSLKHAKKTHSSFGGEGLPTTRWASWTDKEVEIFNLIAGSELQELGYSLGDK